MPTVREIMATRVIWVSKEATFREMAVALREHRVSAFPVVDDDHKVIGVVSEADMLTKEALDDEPGVLAGILHRKDQAKARGVTAGDLMTATVVAVPGTTQSASSAGPTCSRRSTGRTRTSAGRSLTRFSSVSS